MIIESSNGQFWVNFDDGLVYPASSLAEAKKIKDAGVEEFSHWQGTSLAQAENIILFSLREFGYNFHIGSKWGPSIVESTDFFVNEGSFWPIGEDERIFQGRFSVYTRTDFSITVSFYEGKKLDPITFKYTDGKFRGAYPRTSLASLLAQKIKVPEVKKVDSAPAVSQIDDDDLDKIPF